MKIVFRLILASILVMAFLTACEKKTEAPADPATKPADKAEPAKPADPAKPAEPAKTADGVPDKETFIKAAVEMGCLAQTVKDPVQLTEKSKALWSKYGFEQKAFQEASKAYQGDTDMAMKIAAGLQGCAKAPAAAPAPAK